MPYPEINGAQIYYEVHGLENGQPLVLSHGGWADATTWLPVVAALSEKYRVITYDRRGCGRSSAPEGSHSAETWVDDLHRLLQRLGVEKAYVGGLSYGAMISLEFYFAHPEAVDALLLFSGTARGFSGDRPGLIPFP